MFWVSATAAVAVAILLWILRDDNSDVLKAAYDFKDGGGYCSLGDTGVSEPIVYDGILILGPSKSRGTYCCGYTFAVAMKVAQQRGLLKKKDAYEIAHFQSEWYGSSGSSALKECVLAMINLGVGREITPSNAIAGDFVTFQRPHSAGHSVIFLNWIYRDGIIVGLRYRSSQGFTKGIGDAQEYFTTSGYANATIDPRQFFVARLNRW